MNKPDFLDALQTAHAEWEAVLAQVGEARMSGPCVVGDWSVKDLIAHITWFEREMVGVLRARALVGSDLWNLPQDQRNAAILEQNRQRPLSDVLTEAREVFPQLVELVQALDDQDLNDPSRFADMPADWVPWQIIAGNTFDHYRAHAPDLRKWLNGQ
jgi:uncharacterized protein (TIGR03083 family)